MGYSFFFPSSMDSILWCLSCLELFKNSAIIRVRRASNPRVSTSLILFAKGRIAGPNCFFCIWKDEQITTQSPSLSVSLAPGNAREDFHTYGFSEQMAIQSKHNIPKESKINRLMSGEGCWQMKWHPKYLFFCFLTDFNGTLAILFPVIRTDWTVRFFW